MLKRYDYDLELAPVRITWKEELVEDEDSGDFYMKVTPTINWAHDLIESKRTWLGTEFTAKQVSDKIPAYLLGAMARQKIAEKGRRIEAELKKDIERDVQMKLRADYNRRRGQRWNKKV